MRYVLARIEQNNRDEAYRIYVTDALKVMGQLNIRYADVIKPVKVEKRTSDEIIESIRRKIQ